MIDPVTITSAGVFVASYSDILASLQADFRSIYGSDVYLEDDSQDGQWLGILARAFKDLADTTAVAYRSYSPATASGDALVSNVKINGITIDPADFSTVDVMVGGTAGTPISNGQAGDGLNTWNLPASVVIPPAGQILVTATCTTAGAISASVGSVNRILTPTRGWQTVTNPSDASVGTPVETDASLRVKQEQSTALPAITPLESTVAAVRRVAGVTDVKAYENDTGSTDSNGIPAHSISLVVEGGDATEIAQAIALKKTPGTGTYGTTAIVVIDSEGISNTIRFFRPTLVPIQWAITVKALTGYTTSYGTLIQQSLVDFTNNEEIGDDLILTKGYVPANLPGTVAGTTYNITVLQVGLVSGSPGTSNIVIAFNEKATCLITDVHLTVT